MIRNLKKSFKILCTIYLGALLLSWSIQLFFPTTDKPNLYEQEQLIEYKGKQITHGYLQLNRSESDRAVILMPDLFGGAEFLLPLANTLKDSVNIIIPEYPTSSSDGGEVGFSVQDRSVFLDILIDSLGIDQPHLLGHGYGGLLGMELATGQSSSEYKSLTLLSSYGPQELQFLGNYMINRFMYSMLYPVVAIFKYGVPHMGWYYEQPVDLNFANSLSALDQRNVLEQLSDIKIPVQILQPRKDRYVSISMANEIYRLIPHSSLYVVEGNHFMTKNTPGRLTEYIKTFTSGVENDLVQTRDEAVQSRVEVSQEPFDTDNFQTVSGWTLIIIMGLITFISLFSEDLACVAGGLLVASGIIDFWFAVIGACIGVLGADVIIYSLGRWIGNPILQWIPFRWLIKKEDIEKAEQMYRMRGVEIIFATRFLPGTRLPVYLVSGMINVKFSFFLFYFILAMIIWAPLLVWISALVGQPMISYLASYQEQAIWLVPLIMGTVYLVIKGFTLLSTSTGRRKVIVKFGRFREKYLNK